MGVHDLRLRGHGGDLGADGVRAVLLLPQLDQLLGENLTCLPVTTFGHFLDFSLLQGNSESNLVCAKAWRKRSRWSSH